MLVRMLMNSLLMLLGVLAGSGRAAGLHPLTSAGSQEDQEKELIQMLDRVNQLSSLQNTTVCQECQTIATNVSYEAFLVIMAAEASKAAICNLILAKLEHMTVKDCIAILTDLGPIPLSVYNLLIKKNNGFICNFLLGACPYLEGDFRWVDTQALIQQILNSPKPSVAPDPPTPKPKAAPLKILHFSDAHLKLNYVVGSSADYNIWKSSACEFPVQSSSEPLAGKFGANLCDSPIAMFEAFLTYAQPMNPDIIVYTGDNNQHHMAYYKEFNKYNETKYISDRLAATFPKAKIVVNLGNTETAPEDHQFDTIDGTMNWTIQGAANAFSSSLPYNERLSMARNGTYYTDLAQYRLRFISLFSNVYDSENLYLFARTFDPTNAFSFLWSKLAEAESLNYKVIINMHAFPGVTIINQFAVLLNALVQRYSATILIVLTGHSHADTARFFTDVTGDVTGLSFSAVSLTKNFGGNGFKLYQYDSDNAVLLDFSEYVFNIVAGNIPPNPQIWALNYKFTTTYNLPDMSLPSIKQWAANIKSNTHHSASIYNNNLINFQPKPYDMTKREIEEVVCDMMPTTEEFFKCMVRVDPRYVVNKLIITSMLYGEYFTVAHH